ncbi:MAG: GNAT family N-acetyltransferase [Pseudomonadota bacterium]
MHSRKTIVRPAARSDAAALTDISFRAKAYWGYSDEFMRLCTNELTVTAHDIESPDFLYYVAESSSGTIGFYSLAVLTKTEYELDAMYIDPDYIGQGIGKTLIQHARVTSRGKGIECLTIQSDPNAEAFYKAMGATKIGERESASVGGRMLPLLTLRCQSDEDGASSVR